VAYWRDEGIVTRNYATGHAVIGDPLISYILALCGGWTSLVQLRRQLPQVPARTLKTVVATMVEQRLLQRDGDRPDTRERAMQSWRDWNPEAGVFHFGTRNMQVPTDPTAVEIELRQRKSKKGSPPQVKRYANAATVQLPPASTAGEFPEVLLRRRTWRHFSSDAVPLDRIATLLHLTWGVQRSEESPGLGPLHLKTSPSSGARQPLEAYMLAVNIDGLEPGLYHYVGDRHVLERVKRGASPRTIARYIPSQWWYESAAAVFMMTAVFARTQWRYPFPRAYRSVLLEAGHVCQTFCLVATWLGLAPFCTGRFADDAVEKDLRIDGVRESFIYGAGVGLRPPGVDWAPWPPDAAPDSPLIRAPRGSTSE
jgi:SagB-type dehydrogenase family enzyme